MRRAGAAEALECALGEPVGEAAAAIGDDDRQALTVALGTQLDRALAVAQRVVDQVADRLLDPQAVHIRAQLVSAFDLDRASARVGAKREARSDVPEDRP